MNQDVAGRLHGLIEKLRERTGASRTTVRGRAGDDPVALLAESLAPGVESMADGQQPAAIVAAPTCAPNSASAWTPRTGLTDGCCTSRTRPSRAAGTPHLVIPYSLDVNDMRFVGSPGSAHGGQFFEYARDTFDQLYEEGAELPRMMSIGLHCRLSGRPGRARAVARLLDHIGSHEGVWFARRIDIAQHWLKQHPDRWGPYDRRPVRLV